MSQNGLGISKDQWTVCAADYNKFALTGPGIGPGKELNKALNTAYPLSKATAYMDLGCGPGIVLGLLFDEYGSQLSPNIRLTASDISPGMIEQVQQRQKEEVAKANTIWSRVDTVACNAQDLSPMADNSFSHIASAFMLFMIPEPGLALKEIRRVLQPDHGVFACSSWQRNEWAEMMGLITQVRPDAVVPPLPPAWASVAGVRRQLEAAGFRDVEAYTVQSYAPYDDPAKHVRLLFSLLPPMAKIKATMTAEEVDRTCEVMVRYLEKTHPTKPYQMSFTSVIGVGRK